MRAHLTIGAGDNLPVGHDVHILARLGAEGPGRAWVQMKVTIS
jgi:hypothetical protein